LQPTLAVTRAAQQLATATVVESFGVSVFLSGWGSATARVLCWIAVRLRLRIDAGLRVGAGLCCWRDGVVSASAVVALRAAKRLWRNTKAMRG